MILPEIEHKEASWGFTGIGIPAEVFLHQDLTKTAKMLFGLLRNISQTERGCWASNRWLSQFLSVSPRIVSEAISDLEKLGFIKIVTINKQGLTKETERRIYIDLTYQSRYRKLVEQVNESLSTPIAKNFNTHSEKLLGGERETSTYNVNDKVNDVNNSLSDSEESDCNDDKSIKVRFIPSAEKLAKAIQSVTNKKVTRANINKWSVPLERLHRLDGVSIRDIDKALNWYLDHVGEKYVPVIESGTSFREKYHLKLLPAMERSQSKPNLSKAHTGRYLKSSDEKKSRLKNIGEVHSNEE